MSTLVNELPHRTISNFFESHLDSETTTKKRKAKSQRNPENTKKQKRTTRNQDGSHLDNQQKHGKPHQINFNMIQSDFPPHGGDMHLGQNYVSHPDPNFFGNMQVSEFKHERPNSIVFSQNQMVPNQPPLSVANQPNQFFSSNTFGGQSYFNPNDPHNMYGSSIPNHMDPQLQTLNFAMIQPSLHQNFLPFDHLSNVMAKPPLNEGQNVLSNVQLFNQNVGQHQHLSKNIQFPQPFPNAQQPMGNVQPPLNNVQPQFNHIQPGMRFDQQISGLPVPVNDQNIQHFQQHQQHRDFVPTHDQKGKVRSQQGRARSQQSKSRSQQTKSRTKNLNETLDKVDSVDKDKKLVVLDTANICFTHGKRKFFSVDGFIIALNYYVNKGYKVVGFLASYFMKSNPKHEIKGDLSQFEKLIEKNILILTPPQDYDDSYMIKYASKHDGYIVSNDMYRDHIQKQKEEDKKKTTEWLKSRLISFTFIENEFLPNPDTKMEEASAVSEIKNEEKKQQKDEDETYIKLPPKSTKRSATGKKSSSPKITSISNTKKPKTPAKLTAIVVKPKT